MVLPSCVSSRTLVPFCVVDLSCIRATYKKKDAILEGVIAKGNTDLIVDDKALS
tara:strand:- start:41 stop:202 length:162 start_codon:yes stop_codon:yes gene_type:complete